MALHSALNIDTHLAYLDRNALYKVEKPYGADYNVDEIDGAQMSNHITSPFATTVYDMRHREAPSLMNNGFCVLNAKTSLTASEASHQRTPAIDAYLTEIEELLYKEFPEYSRIEILDYNIRKRATGFPNAVGTKVEFEQPAAVPHTDFSVEGAFMRMRDLFPGQEAYYTKRAFDLINVWRVLKGPNDDWPLAICDFQTVDMSRDVSPNDCLHQSRTGENWLLYANKNHRWHYLSAQEESELLVFRNTDSEGKRACGFHAAFKNERAQCAPRQSVEVRVVAFR